MLRRSMTMLILVLLGVSLALTTTATANAAADIPRFEPGPCPIEVPEEPMVECGTLVAPEDYENPAGRTVRLGHHTDDVVRAFQELLQRRDRKLRRTKEHHLHDGQCTPYRDWIAGPRVSNIWT